MNQDTQRNQDTRQTVARRTRLLGAALFGLAMTLFAASSQPASAQTIYDADYAERIRGVSPQVREQLRAISKTSRAQFMATLGKYGIDPDAKPNMDQLMKASKDLQAISQAEKQAIQPLLKPEEMAQYYSMVAATTQRVREALR